MNINKPLSEWTLAEVKKYCQAHSCLTSGNICMFRGSICPARLFPALWELDNEGLVQELNNGKEA